MVLQDKAEMVVLLLMLKVAAAVAAAILAVAVEHPHKITVLVGQPVVAVVLLILEE